MTRTLISSQPATGNSITFSGIPSGFDRLELDISGVSFALAAGQFRYEFSADGVVFTAPVVIGPGFAASLAHTGRIAFADPGADIGLVTGQQGVAPGSGFSTATGISGLRACVGGIAAIRITPKPGDSFDAGALSLYGI